MGGRARLVPYLVLLLPFDLLVVLGFTIAGFIGFVGRGLKPATPRKRPENPVVAGFSPRSSTILIVNWDGRHLLEECLPAVLQAVKCEGGKHEVLVVDNGSTDGSVDFVQRYFPEVRVLALDRNYGFGGGNNRGVAEVRTEIVVFLNNDMVVDRTFLKPLLDGFSDRSIFAVTSQIFLSDPSRRREETGKTRARFDRGFFYFWHDEIHAEDEAAAVIPVFWAGGGSCAFDRRKYEEIGGFDGLYAPFYMEDTDLSYQAWKRGWKCVMAPSSRVIHKHRATSRAKFGNRFVDNTIRRNQYLFTWKNVTDLDMVLDHFLRLPRIQGRLMLQTDPLFEIQAFFRAFQQLPRALWRRHRAIQHSVITDRDVLARTS